MIKKLQLINFQSHKDTTLEFSPGLNIIAGGNHNGKTAIFRAIKWIVTNRPSGESFQRWNSGHTTVILDNDNHIISRDKGINNSYTVDGMDGVDGMEFEKVGTSVPEEVEKALNLSLDNFQHQHDPPFLLSDTPGEVSKKVNEIFHLDEINSLLQITNKRKRKVSKKIKQSEENITQLKKNIDALKWTRKAFEIGNEIAELNNQVEFLSAKIELINHILYEYQSIPDISRIPDIIYSAKESIECMKKYTLIDTLLKEADDLYNPKLESFCKNGGELLDGVKKCDEDLSTLSIKIDIMRKLLNDVYDTNSEIIDCNKIIIETKKKLPKDCPLCGGPL